MDIFFFGCKSPNRKGHCLYKVHFFNDWHKEREIQAALSDVCLDGGLLKEAGVRDIPRNGCYAQRGGYSIVSWWDRGGDSRGASNSAFIAEGNHSPQEVMRLGRAKFPTITERSKAVRLPDGTEL